MANRNDAAVAKWRADTPGCEYRNHLNNAGAALMPRSVRDAIKAHIDLEANIGGYEAANACEERIDAVYGDVARLIGSPGRNVAIVANATAGFIQAMSSFDFARGDTIIATRADYTSYQIHFLALTNRLGVRVEYAEELPSGGVDPESVRTLARRHRPRLVHVSWVPTHSGLVQDVEGVGAVCAELDVPYVIDACQAVGQIPIDVERLRCDYLSVTARKFLRGPRGIGFMYASDRALARGDHPLYVDMRGATWIAPDRYELNDSAKRYEDWEFPYALVLGLGEAARYALEVGIDVAHDRSHALANYLRRELSGISGARVLDPGAHPSAIVTTTFDRVDAPTIVAELAKRHINTTATLQWYGLLDLGPRHIDSAVRISPHYYNTEEEVTAAVDAIRSIVASK